jgi:hypothetical protein
MVLISLTEIITSADQLTKGPVVVDMDDTAAKHYQERAASITDGLIAAYSLKDGDAKTVIIKALQAGREINLQNWARELSDTYVAFNDRYPALSRDLREGIAAMQKLEDVPASAAINAAFGKASLACAELGAAIGKTAEAWEASQSLKPKAKEP